jgi:hypothetical protein
MNCALDNLKQIRHYEDASLSYSGIDRHEEEGVGLFSTVISADEYLELSH